MTDTKNRSHEMVRIACDTLEDKKAVNIRVIDISEVSVIADYFVVANGTNSNHVRTLVDSVDEKLYKAGYSIGHQEGSNAWVLMDYHDVIIHIFDEENRMFYDLEKIWSDGRMVSLEDLA